MLAVSVVVFTSIFSLLPFDEFSFSSSGANVVAIISSSDGCATLTFSQSMLLSFNEKLIIESNYVLLNYDTVS